MKQKQKPTIIQERGRAEGAKPPSSLRDVPRYMRELIGGFFYRLWYIIKLVWETSPAILFALAFIALFNGVMPPIVSIVSSRILNELQLSFSVDTGSVAFFASPIFGLLIFLFAYRILNAVVGRIHSAVVRVAGERVVRHVRLKSCTRPEKLTLPRTTAPSFMKSSKTPTARRDTVRYKRCRPRWD